MIVNRLDDGRDKYYSEVCFSAALDSVWCFPVILGVGLGADSVEAHVEVAETVIAQRVRQIGVECKVDPVCVELDMVYSFLFDDTDNFRKLWSESWFSPGYLELVPWDRPLGFEGSDHFSDLVKSWLVNVRSFQPFLHIEEAVPAGQVAAVGDNDVREARVD